MFFQQSVLVLGAVEFDSFSHTTAMTEKIHKAERSDLEWDYILWVEHVGGDRPGSNTHQDAPHMSHAHRKCRHSMQQLLEFRINFSGGPAEANTCCY